MKLTLEELKDLITGAVELDARDGMYHFYRFAADQAEKYITVAQSENFYCKTSATAGVRLECVTDASAFGFRFDAKAGSSRRYCRFDVYVDGAPAEFMLAEDPKEFWQGEFRMELPEGEHKLTLYFPNLYGMAIGDVELADSTYIKPCVRKYTMVCFGDSITQGYDSVCPAVSYVNRMADELDAAVVDKGIGGDRFFPALLEVNDGFEPDLVTVAYGTNDWRGSTREEFEERLAGFMNGLSVRYPEAKVFIVTPLWRGNYLATDTKAGSFAQVSADIRAEAEKYGFTVIDGMTLLPHDPAYFMQDVLHPNDKGHALYGKNLAEEIKKYL